MVAATFVYGRKLFLNLKFTGSTGKFCYSIFLESRSVLRANFSSAYITINRGIQIF